MPDCTDKEFVGITITRDADFNYYMDQTRMITEIIKEAKLTGAKDERLMVMIQLVMIQTLRQTQPRRSRSLNALSTHTVG